MPKSSQAKVGGKGNKKIGRNNAKCQRYRAMGTREKNKLRRVLRSSGEVAALEYAREHNLTAYLKKL